MYRYKILHFKTTRGIKYLIKIKIRIEVFVINSDGLELAILCTSLKMAT
jgi:hypothetical protein